MGHFAQFAQARPADTNAATLFTAVRGYNYKVRLIVCNTTGGGLTFRAFHDENGTTFDETTALAFDTAIGANAIVYVPTEGWIYMDNEGDDAIGVRTSSANGLTFTLYGEREKD